MQSLQQTWSLCWDHREWLEPACARLLSEASIMSPGAAELIMQLEICCRTPDLVDLIFLRFILILVQLENEV